jgi:hypothetical protein
MSDVPALDLRSRAEEDLRAIRHAMEGSSRFTSVSGKGEIAVGATALAAAALAARQGSATGWLAVWIVEAALATALALSAAARKARGGGSSLRSLPARRFALSLAPPIVAGTALTPVLFRAGLLDVLPGLWMLLYGAGVVTGGAFSVRPVPLAGVALMLAGAGSLAFPEIGRDAWMAAGFGGVHLALGVALLRSYGG